MMIIKYSGYVTKMNSDFGYIVVHWNATESRYLTHEII